MAQYEVELLIRRARLLPAQSDLEALAQAAVDGVFGTAENEAVVGVTVRETESGEASDYFFD